MSDKKEPSKTDKKATLPSHPNEPRKQTLICNRGVLYSVRVPREGAREDQLSLSTSEYERILARARDPIILAKEKELGETASQKKRDDLKAAEEKKHKMMAQDRRAVRQEEQADARSKQRSSERYRHMRCKAQTESDNQILKLDTYIRRCKIQADADTQREWKKRCEAVAISREKADFERALECHREALDKHEEKGRRRKEEGRLHLQALQEQIREKERAAAVGRRERLSVAKHVSDEVQLKNKCIEEIKEERLSDFRACGIPDKYYGYVKKRTAEDGAKSKNYQYHMQ
ncbi:uncharacterized protein LOC144009462 [Festucalex cinctus]